MTAFNILILEDSKKRIKTFRQQLIGHNVVDVLGTKECIDLLKEKEWDYLFLDHDLLDIHYAMLVKGHKGVAPGTGRDVAKWLSENPDRSPKKMVIIHSLNPVGSQKMFDLLDGKVTCDVKKVPFAWDNVKG